MRHGFIKVASATPTVRVADCQFNADSIHNLIIKAQDKDVQLLVLPELCVSASTCGDLFLQQALIDSCLAVTVEIASIVPKNMVVVFGAPLIKNSRLYNCAVVCSAGKILGVVPKSTLKDSEKKFFTCPQTINSLISIGDFEVPFGTGILFKCNQMQSFILSCALGIDVISPYSHLPQATAAGAVVVAGCLANPDFSETGLRKIASAAYQSKMLKSGFVCAQAGFGESTTDFVYTADNCICENGVVLASQKMTEDELLVSELDLQYLGFARRSDSYDCYCEKDSFDFIPFNIEMGEVQLTRKISRNPFLPADQKRQRAECERIFTLQALGLKQRIEHSHAKSIVIGISGGLDSTLALLVAVRVADMLDWERSKLICVTMPCFGTSNNTKNNAINLVQSFECTLREINIGESVLQHFSDIGHDESTYDAAYENSQARERTQVLMDIANMEGGIVLGTGDLSELALGWATYNGDQMSMYSVNASVPKTVIRIIVDWYASVCDSDELRNTLYGVLDTPVSPELVPGTQNTEDIVGPYELHDFFIYSTICWGCTPSKVYRLAKQAFGEEYSDETVLNWLRTFYRRFFAQQFKRSCMPDGPKVTAVSFSPRGGWQMPSDACLQIWKQELEQSII